MKIIKPVLPTSTDCWENWMKQCEVKWMCFWKLSGTHKYMVLTGQAQNSLHQVCWAFLKVSFLYNYKMKYNTLQEGKMLPL